MAERVPSLRKNSIYNLAGHFVPTLAGLILIPHLIQNLGLERFGIMTIVWAVIGYFSLFDFGLGRTITMKISQLDAENAQEKMSPVFWTSMKLIFLITLLGSALLWFLSSQPQLLSEKASAQVTLEAISSLKIMALTLPAITLTAGFKGALEASHHFFGLNVLQSLLGFLNFVVPYLISLHSPQLPAVVLALAAIRYLFLLFHSAYLFKTCRWIGKPHFLGWSESLPLLFAGGWFTVTNVVGPLMVYFDRFFLAMLISPAQISFYTTPFEIVNRLLILPSSITRALFPILAASSKAPQTAEKAYRKSFQSIGILCTSLAIFGILTGFWGLQIWIGREFAESSFPILAILLVGFATNALAWTPFHLIQALNRPDLSAKVHLLELPFYCALLYFLATHYGIRGAAIAWTLRNSVDFVIMFFISENLKKKLWKQN